MLWLTTRLGDTLYRVKFIITEHFSVNAIICTAFVNRHVVGIMYREQKIRLRKDTIPIVGFKSPLPFQGKDSQVELQSATWTYFRTSNVPRQGISGNVAPRPAEGEAIPEQTRYDFPSGPYSFS